jgi:hypothetical protein
MLNLEKSARLAEDVTATKAACIGVLELVYQAKQWKLLEEQILLLAKRRSQLKQVGLQEGFVLDQSPCTVLSISSSGFKVCLGLQSPPAAPVHCLSRPFKHL